MLYLQIHVSTLSPAYGVSGLTGLCMDTNERLYGKFEGFKQSLRHWLWDDGARAYFKGCLEFWCLVVTIDCGANRSETTLDGVSKVSRSITTRSCKGGKRVWV